MVEGCDILYGGCNSACGDCGRLHSSCIGYVEVATTHAYPFESVATTPKKGEAGLLNRELVKSDGFAHLLTGVRVPT